MESGQEANITGFWTWFADMHLEILEIMGGRRAGLVTELIDRALEQNGLNLTYEVTEGRFGGELTFTPQGDPETARFIDRFVASAPSFDTWVIFGRIPRKPLSGALAFVEAIHKIDISDARFKFLYLEDQYHLCFLHDGIFAKSEEERFAIASTFLEHALGEDIFMDCIGQLEFKRSGDGVAMPLLINAIIGAAAQELAPGEAAKEDERTLDMDQPPR